jgi:DNA-binding CsgD family transcriptional regulator
MGESPSLRARDYKAVFQLIGECRELGADPLAWRNHQVQGACKLTGAIAGINTEARAFFHEPDFRIRLNIYSGFDDVTLHIHKRYLEELGFYKFDEPFDEYVRIHRTLTTRSQEQLIRRDQWYRSALFNDFFRPCCFDDRMLSGYRIRLADGAGGHGHDCLCLLRALGDPPFTRRHRRLVRLLHREIAPMIGRQLTSADEPSAMQLSSQRREVLDCLLDGMSEKQVAARLGLTPQTVHQYVKAIYRHFRVGSRAELMARWIRFGRGGQVRGITRR